MVREAVHVEQMKLLCKHIKDLLGDIHDQNVLSKRDLTRAYGIWKADLEMDEVLVSWVTKIPDWLTDFLHHQARGECWAIALSRAITVLKKLRGKWYNHPTPQELIDIVGPRHLNANGELRDIKNSLTYALPGLIANNYITQMAVHESPWFDHEEQNEEFEKGIIRLLAQGPVPICFDFMPTYNDCFQGIFTPSDRELQIRAAERLPKHCVLLTGVGVKMINGVATEFWEVRENFSDSHFVRLARHMCMIRHAIDIEV